MIDPDISTGDIRLQVEGLSKTLRALSKAGADASDMRDLMHAIGMTVVHAADIRVPRKSGDLARSMRAGRGKTKAVVRAGGRKVPYGPVQHYGWPEHNIRPKPFFIAALAATQARVYAQLDDGIADIIKRNHLR